MIRRATLADVPALEDMLLKVKRRSEFCTVKVEFERARKAARQCISSQQGFAAVAEHDGKITGCMLGVVTSLWFSPQKIGSDIAWVSFKRGDGRALFCAWMDWLNSKGAIPYMGQSTGRHGRTLAAFYREFGLVPMGTLWIGEKPIRVPHLRSVEK